MNKLSCLCLLCLLGMVPSASTQYTGGSGDGYASASLSPGSSGEGSMYTGSQGDGYHSGSAMLRVTRYVATAGSDAGNDCTNPSNKCGTITHAVSKANAKDILDVEAGTYTELGLVIDKALTIQWQGVVVQ